MDSFHMQVAWAVFIWIWVISLLFTYLEDRIITRIKPILGEKAKGIGKNSFLNQIQNFKNMIFFFKYNIDASDPKEVAVLIRKAKYLNVFYYAQLICLGVFMIMFFESK